MKHRETRSGHVPPQPSAAAAFHARRQRGPQWKVYRCSLHGSGALLLAIRTASLPRLQEAQVAHVGEPSQRSVVCNAMDSAIPLWVQQRGLRARRCHTG